MSGQTLYEKLWAAHEVEDYGDGVGLIYIDRSLVHEVSSPQAFEGLRAAGRPVRRPASHLAVADHAVPTRDRGRRIADPLAREQVALLAANTEAFGIRHLSLADPRQGIVHVIGPELGFTLPGMSLVCGDSHTSTHGALGALAFGIGASECECVLATQCLRQTRARTLRINVSGRLGRGVTAKDLTLAIVAQLGATGGVGYAIEYTGEAVRALSVEGRMTLCNMSIEAGARIGLIAPDETTFAYVAGRPMAPTGAAWEAALSYWRTLQSDDDAVFDRTVEIDAAAIAPRVTWGTSPDQSAPVTAAAPDPARADTEAERRKIAGALQYMDLQPGQPLIGLAVDNVFIGSCTNGRIEDLRAAAEVARHRHVAASVTAIVVPGSGAVKRQAEAEGLDQVFMAAGFEWREPGCSLCVARSAMSCTR